MKSGASAGSVRVSTIARATATLLALNPGGVSFVRQLGSAGSSACTTSRAQQGHHVLRGGRKLETRLNAWKTTLTPILRQRGTLQHRDNRHRQVPRQGKEGRSFPQPLSWRRMSPAPPGVELRSSTHGVPLLTTRSEIFEAAHGGTSNARCGSIATHACPATRPAGRSQSRSPVAPRRRSELRRSSGRRQQQQRCRQPPPHGNSDDDAAAPARPDRARHADRLEHRRTAAQRGVSHRADVPTPQHDPQQDHHNRDRHHDLQRGASDHDGIARLTV